MSPAPAHAGILRMQLRRGTDLIVTYRRGHRVSGGSYGIARNYGTGALTVTANGNVTSTYVSSPSTRNTPRAPISA